MVRIPQKIGIPPKKVEVFSVCSFTFFCAYLTNNSLFMQIFAKEGRSPRKTAGK